MVKLAKIFAYVLASLAVLVLVWGGVVVIWQEPVTGAIHAHQQHALKQELQRSYKHASASKPRAEHVTTRRHVSASVTASKPSPRVPALHEGQPMGTLKGRGINAIVIYGRQPSSISKGPGLWHARPGYGRTAVISGHRTTYGAPFRRINGLKRGDVLTLRTPWGTWKYRVYRKAIVDPNDVSVAQDRGFEQLVLTACHPVYSAAQRYIVFAKAIQVRR